MKLQLKYNFKCFCVQKISVVGRKCKMFVDVFYFETNREMPKMNPSLHYEDIQVFWTLYKSLIEFRIEKKIFLQKSLREKYSIYQNLHM